MSNTLTPAEKSELKELIKLKKAGKLDDSSKARLEELNSKMGYTRSRDGGKGKVFRPGNAFAWWNKYPELVKDSANMKSDYIAGTEIVPGDIPVVIPGVLRITLKACYGSSTKSVDPINEWARELFLRMFQKYRIPNNYGAEDLGIVILAAIEIARLIAKYERIYGVINRYSILNKNMPYAEIQALGLSIADMTYLQGHLSDFRFDLNVLISRAQKVVLPKDMSVIDDSISLMGYEYLDHESGRSQIIVFDTDEAGVYSDITLTSGSSVEFRTFGGSGFKMFNFNSDNMCEALETAIDALVGSDSVQKIMADLDVWFGDNNMLHFLPIDENYKSVPVYSEEILHKMHNIEMLTGTNLMYGSWAAPGMDPADESRVLVNRFIYQANGNIITRFFARPVGVGVDHTIGDGGKVQIAPDGNDDCQAIDKCHLIDTYRVEVTPETVVEGVMYKFSSQFVEDGTSNVGRVFNSTSLWIATSITLYNVNGIVGNTFSNVVKNAAPSDVYVAAARLAVIDWAPLAYYLDNNVNAPGITNVFGDVDNAFGVYPGHLYKLHRTIILSGLKTDLQVVKS